MKSLARSFFLLVITVYSSGLAVYMGFALRNAYNDQNGIGLELILFVTATVVALTLTPLNLHLLKKRGSKNTNALIASIALLLLLDGVILASTFSNRITPVFLEKGPPVQYTAPATEEPEPIAPTVEESAPAEKEQSTISHIKMAYINEAPDDNWTGSWKNACEEAAIAIVEYYYTGVKTVDIEKVKAYMQTMFDAQKKEYGSDANSDSVRTLKLIEDFASFDAVIVTDPTLDSIKAEIDAGRPVIALHHGFDLGNKNIPFLATGSSYHATVVTGYNDETKQFIVHDTGDRKAGADHLYSYEVYMNSLHDYTYGAELANGPARVLFTYPRP